MSTTKGNWPLLVADREMAMARLRRREAHLLSVFGCQTSPVVATFSAKLATFESSTLILDSTEMDMQLSQSAEQWREDLQAMLSAFQSEAQVPVKWSTRLFGGAATSYNAGWRAYFRHHDRQGSRLYNLNRSSRSAIRRPSHTSSHCPSPCGSIFSFSSRSLTLSCSSRTEQALLPGGENGTAP